MFSGRCPFIFVSTRNSASWQPAGFDWHREGPLPTSPEALQLALLGKVTFSPIPNFQIQSWLSKTRNHSNTHGRLFVHWLWTNFLDMHPPQHTRTELPNSENAGAVPVHNHVHTNWITMPYVIFGIHPTNHRMHHASAFLTITKRMSFHSINLIYAINYPYPCRAKASENPPKPDSSLCPGALLEMWFATWSRKHSLKTPDFLPIAIDRCIVIYLDLCKTCAQQTQLIGSYVFGWSFRLSMPRLGKSWISHIRWSKKYQTLWSIWNHDFQRCCKYFEFQFHPSPTRYCQDCIRLLHHSEASRDPMLALCIALEDLLKQNRK